MEYLMSFLIMQNIWQNLVLHRARLKNWVYISWETVLNQKINCQVNINQAAPAKVILSGESLCEESLTKAPNAHDYALYIDLTYADGTKKYGITAPFSTDTKEWQKKSVEFMPEKAIKQLRIYILYRNQTGKVQFKNLKLEEVK